MGVDYFKHCPEEGPGRAIIGGPILSYQTKGVI